MLEITYTYFRFLVVLHFSLGCICLPAQERGKPQLWEASFAKLSLGDQALKARKYSLAAQEYRKGLNILKSEGKSNPLLYAELKDRYEVAKSKVLSKRGKVSKSVNPICSIKERAETIVIPKFHLSGVTLPEALDVLREEATKHEQRCLSSEQGVSFVLKSISSKLKRERFNLHLNQSSIIQILKALEGVIDVQVEIGEYAISISEKSDSEVLQTKSYTLSSTKLLRNINLETLPQKHNSESNVITPYTIQQLLESLGVKFSQGCSAITLSASDTLIVRNTKAQHHYIKELIQQMDKGRGELIQLEVMLISTRKDSKSLDEAEWSLGGSLRSFLSAGNVFFATSSRDDSIENGLRVNSLERLISEGGFLYDPLAVSEGQTLQDSLIKEDSLEQEFAALSANERMTSGVVSITAGFSQAVADVLLKGVQQQKYTTCLVRPHVVTQSGQQVEIQSGKEFRYPTHYSPPQISSGEHTFWDDEDLGGYTWRENYDDNLARLNALYAKDVLTSHYTTSVTPSHPTQFTTTFLGTDLTLIPSFTPGSDIINLSINLTHREFDGYINYGSPIQTISRQITFDRDWLRDNETLFGGLNSSPSLLSIMQGLDNANDVTSEQYVFQATENMLLQPLFSKVVAQTNVSLFNGTTVLLGGVLKTNQVEAINETPVLSRIPLLGRLFDSEIKQRIDKQIFVAIQATVITPQGAPLN